MSLLYNKSVIDHLVVIELLHLIHLSASIGNPELGLKCIPHVLARRHVHVHLQHALCQDTEKSPPEQVIYLIKPPFFLSREGRLDALSLDHVLTVHSSEPQRSPHTPDLVICPTILQGWRFQ